MKILALLSTIALACTIDAALAQETETPTSESTAKPFAEPASSPEESPATTKGKTYPTPGEATEASSKKTAATPSASPASKPTPNKSSAPATAKPSATPLVLKGNADAQIRQIEDAYESGLQAHNSANVEPFLANDAVITDSKNRVMNRSAAIAEFKKNSDTLTTAKNSDMKVRMVDKDVAVCTGISREAGKDKSGKAFDRRYRFTDTFVNRNGKWMLVASHASLLGGR